MAMRDAKDDLVFSLMASIDAAEQNETPFRYWFAKRCLPMRTVDGLLSLPFAAPVLGGISGTRELHNATRKYFNTTNRWRFPVCSSVCEAFQDSRVTDRIARRYGADLRGTYLRVEYAQDTDGFWLEPHTDLGVKRFTMLLYISRNRQHRALGTDIYDTEKRPVQRTPFACNCALAFVPSSISYHGFERRPIEGVRQSIIINYVSGEWRAREQLAFPEAPVAL
jgi:hypothetical protein